MDPTTPEIKEEDIKVINIFFLGTFTVSQSEFYFCFSIQEEEVVVMVAWEDMVSNDITYTVIPGPQWWCLNLIGGGYAGQGTVLPRGNSIDQ